MKRLKKILYEVLILIFPVMLGVYLGLLANNWSLERAEQKQTEKTLKNILQEITYNENVNSESLNYFTQLRDSIYGLENRNTRPSSFSFWKGLNPPSLKNASFQSASISGILGRLDIDLLEQLTLAYNFQEDVVLQSRNYAQSVTNKIGSENFTNEKYLIILENYAHDQVAAEEALNKELRKTKELITDYLNSI